MTPRMVFVAHLVGNAVVTRDLVMPEPPAAMDRTVVLAEQGQHGKRQAEKGEVCYPP